MRNAWAILVIKRNLALAAAGWVLVCAGASNASSATIDSALIGAWTTYATDCNKLFDRSGGAVSLRTPIDKFAQAVIIDPQKIRTPASICRVKTVQRQNNAFTIDAECQDSISYTPASLRVKLQAPGTIVYSPSGDPVLDTTLVRCVR